jgi:hypothetical protein
MMICSVLQNGVSWWIELSSAPNIRPQDAVDWTGDGMPRPEAACSHRCTSWTLMIGRRRCCNASASQLWML